MEEPNFPGNSKADKEKAKEIASTQKDEPKIERVVTGRVKHKKRGLGAQIVEHFAGDDARGVGGYILFDILIPAAKDALVDSVSKGAERLFFGDVRGRVRTGSVNNGRPGYTNYNSVSSHSPAGRAGEPDGRSLSRAARASHNFGEIVIPDRGEAEYVIETLGDIISQYDRARVSDLYELVGITGHPVDDRWGWTSIVGAKAERVREGYLLVLPRPISLD